MMHTLKSRILGLCRRPQVTFLWTPSSVRVHLAVMTSRLHQRPPQGFSARTFSF